MTFEFILVPEKVGVYQFGNGIYPCCKPQFCVGDPENSLSFAEYSANLPLLELLLVCSWWIDRCPLRIPLTLRMRRSCTTASENIHPTTPLSPSGAVRWSSLHGDFPQIATRVMQNLVAEVSPPMTPDSGRTIVCTR